MIFRILIQKYSILYYIYNCYWIFLITILTYTLYSIIIYDINCIKFLIRYICILLYNMQYYYILEYTIYIYIDIYNLYKYFNFNCRK